MMEAYMEPLVAEGTILVGQGLISAIEVRHLT
ncbi:MAG: hypothetical protein JWP01_1918 [Myxococcales bacterium]|nr:hypothetical protein [Myxococcales bacterium]